MTMLRGHDAAVAAFLDAAHSGRLHHAWLLAGPQGIGKALFAEIMAWLQSGGPRDVWIGVWSENFGAQRFYERQGFEKVGEYGFEVGKTVDLEFILKRPAESFSTQAA